MRNEEQTVGKRGADSLWLSETTLSIYHGEAAAA